MDASPSLLIVICAYNEVENVPWLYDRLRELTDASILVVDDNSPDGTGDWCDTTAAIDKSFFVIHRSGKLGLGSATLEAFQFAIDHKFQLVLTMDGDRSHNPADVPRIVDRLLEGEANDLCIGSRYVAGGKIEGWPWRRHLMSIGINRLSRIMIGLPIGDYSSAFRCYRVSLLQKISLNEIAATGYAYLEELLWHAKRHDAKIVEQPILFTNRLKGQSKINMREAIRAVWIILGIGVSRISRRKCIINHR